MTQVERAVERGRGPSKLKDSFFVEDIARLPTPQHSDDFDGPHAWACRLQHRIDMTSSAVGGSSEASRPPREVTHSGRTAYITLPCTKTDIVGLCVTRSHPCCCSKTPKLCPYHALQRRIDRLTALGCPRDGPLFPGADGLDGQPLQHHETIEIFRSVIAATGTSMTREGPNGILFDRFCEHVCRVSGAQMLTRRGFPLDTVQLIGRWGSDAIEVYVQEAPLHRGDEFHRPDELTKPEQVREMVEHYLETLRTKFWVVNSLTKVVHLPGVSESSCDNTHWRTFCGWPYGLAPHRREYREPAGPKCKRCSKLRGAQDFAEAQPDDDDE